MKISFWELKALGTKKYDADAVASLRNRFNLSKSEFAEILNVTPRQVYRWEKGQSIPTGSALSLLHMIDVVDMEETDRLNHFRSKGKIDKHRVHDKIDDFFNIDNQVKKFVDFANMHKYPGLYSDEDNYYDKEPDIYKHNIAKVLRPK